MNKKLKRTLKWAALSLAAVAATLLTVIAIAINFIFTPEKLTPLVENVASQSLKARLSMDRVELTFFSTFPKFGLSIEHGALVSRAIKDSLWDATDSLATFGRCLVEVSPLDYLTSRKVSIHQLTLEDATVYAYRSKEGLANWDIVYPDTAAVADTATAAPEISEIAVDRVQLRESDVIFDDRDTRIYARMEGASLDLKAQLRKDHSSLDLTFAHRNLLLWQDGELLANHLRTQVSTQLELAPGTGQLTLRNTSLHVNGIALDVEGTLQKDSLLHAAHADLRYSLHAPSMTTVLQLIPESIVKKGEVDASGEVLIDGHIKGLYGEGHMPLATLGIKIKNAAAHYKGMPYGIDHVDLDFNAYVDLMRRTPSHADLNIFRFEGAHTRILANAHINHLLTDPDITFNVRSAVDLTALSQTFPLQEGVAVSGGLNANLSARCRLSSLRRQDYGRVRINGELRTDNLTLTDRNRGFAFRSDAGFQFSGKDQLAAALTVNRIELQSRPLASTIRQLKATVSSTLPQDTTRIAQVKCKFEVSEIKGSSGDSLHVCGKKAKATASLHPGTRNPSQPEISLSLDADSVSCRLNQRELSMDKGGFGIRAEKVNDSIWTPSGIIGFHRLSLRTPELKLPIRLQRTAITIKDQRLMLKRARMTVGKSDITATGAIFNLYDAVRLNRPVRAQLDISSTRLDGNQLINALNSPGDPLATAADTLSDEAPMELFVLPRNIDFELHTQLDRVTYGKMLFEQVRGAVDVRRQSIHLKNLSMRGLDADMRASLVYHASEKKRGYTGFDFKLEKVNIGKLVDFIPALDSIVPMLRSFKGIVNFDATAEAVLDSALNIQIPTLRSAVHIKGDSLVLMDGETFAEISKMMMFKNKKRNLIDSIYVNMTVDNGNVTVYPFVVQMDRYRAAVGGTQDLDMNFKYHISVLKSPVPFKLGVNITGNLDKMKIRVGKAKYKDQVTPVAIRKVDSTRVNLGRDIIRDFERVVQNAGKQ